MSRQASVLKPPLKWAGGKRWLIPRLKRYWRPFRDKRLVEPFCGGLAVALGLMPERALLNDINPALINFYQHLKNGLTLDIELANDEQLYYAHRQRFNALDDESAYERAQLFYYLNRTGYNGLCRFNQSGGFNVPFGRYKTINYIEDFSVYEALLSCWTFSCVDFEKLQLQPDDFIYADPPYDVPFRQYSQQGFDWDDQVRLAHWLAQHDGPVVLSNQATPRIRELYGDLGFRLRYLQAPRRISCKASQRQHVREVLAIRGF